MKISKVQYNNRKKAFEIETETGAILPFPYAKVAPPPDRDDPVIRAYVDPELGGEGFSYALRSSREGTVHVEQVLEYNKDPGYLRDLMLYKLTIEARKRIEDSPLSRREVIRRLGTSATQLYRLLDPTNYRKSVDQLLTLLHVLDCDVELVVQAKSA